jgi:hypothetical protein
MSESTSALTHISRISDNDLPSNCPLEGASLANMDSTLTISRVNALGEGVAQGSGIVQARQIAWGSDLRLRIPWVNISLCCSVRKFGRRERSIAEPLANLE